MIPAIGHFRTALMGAPPVAGPSANPVADSPGRQVTNNGATPQAEPPDWLHFAGRSGEVGQAWAAEYRRHFPSVELSRRALALMHRHQIEEGHATLQEFARALEELQGIPSSMRSLMKRWYHGVAGYYFYCIEDFDQAQQSMCLADQAVVDAISESDFLLPLAVHCQEFCLHQARIARNRRRWTEMNRYLNRSRAMMLDLEPLCQTRQGSPIFFSTLGRFYSKLEPLSNPERESIQGLVEEGQRAWLFDRFVRRLLKLPGVAIEYP
jgi:hypothetical protein